MKNTQIWLTQIFPGKKMHSIIEKHEGVFWGEEHEYICHLLSYKQIVGFFAS